MNEPTLYVKKEGMNGLVIVSLYVDDMIYTGSSLTLISKFRDSMMNMFDMTDLGELKYFLGVEIVQNETRIFMSQKKYIEDTLKKFNMSGCKMASTPMNLNEKFSVNDETEMANAIVYRSLIGRLIYLTHSRLDITYAVGSLSRFMHKPSKHHLGAARRILRYLGGSKEYGIWFRKNDKFCLYTDSDWAGSVDDRRSTSGHCFLIGTAAVSWSSKKQATVALSSTEAEYVAATTSACQAIWLRRLLSDLGEEQEHATSILCDSRSAVQLSRNPVFHCRTKHIEIKHHFVRELIEKGEVVLESCRTEEQVADLMTKSLPLSKHDEFCLQLGLSKFE